MPVGHSNTNIWSRAQGNILRLSCRFETHQSTGSHEDVRSSSCRVCRVKGKESSGNYPEQPALWSQWYNLKYKRTGRVCSGTTRNGYSYVPFQSGVSQPLHSWLLWFYLWPDHPGKTEVVKKLPLNPRFHFVLCISLPLMMFSKQSKRNNLLNTLILSIKPTRSTKRGEMIHFKYR